MRGPGGRGYVAQGGEPHAIREASHDTRRLCGANKVLTGEWKALSEQTHNQPASEDQGYKAAVQPQGLDRW